MQGEHSAQQNLGIMYLEGTGTSRNYPEALEWLREAAHGEISEACRSLGHRYEYGNGVDRNLVVAVELYRKAAEQGLVTAQLELLRRL